MYNPDSDQFPRMEITCGSLLMELQKIWDEVGEPEVERDKMLSAIERECLDVYKRKVDEASTSRSQLQREIAAADAEIHKICSTLAENPVEYEQDKVSVSLKEKLQAVIPRLEETQKRREERKELFFEVVNELHNISVEIFGSVDENLRKVVTEGTDLSMRKLEELKERLRELQNEKSNRLMQVEGHLNSLESLCGVLGVGFKQTIHLIHPSLDDSRQAKDITDDTIRRLAIAIQSLREEKIQRMHKLQDLAVSLLELWNLMDTSIEEQKMFHNVTSKIAASEDEITELNVLSSGFISQVEEEVLRLEQLKSGQMKELLLKKRLELEEICRKMHMVSETLTSGRYSIEAVESGAEDPLFLLEDMEQEISKTKEEAVSRMEILDKVEKWLAALVEECWLEEYNRDNNRYNAGRGAHLALRRAEKARALVNKIPAMVEALASKVTAWERERGMQFLYDGERLLTRLEEYSNLRQEKDQERIRKRDQRRLQVQQVAEQEALYGSKPSPSKSGKKTSRSSTGIYNDRKLSLGGAMLQNLGPGKPSPRVHPHKKDDRLNRNSSLSYQQHGGFASQSSGRRNTEIPSSLVRKHSATAAKSREPEGRKPLSPIPLTLSSKANIPNFLEDQNAAQSGTLQTAVPCAKTLIGTPIKSVCSGNDENRTPKALPIPVPATPPTITAPMLMALTPATPYVCSAAKKVQNMVEQIEYSFEELRAGFFSLKT